MIFVALFGIAALVGLARALGFAGGEPATARGSWLDGGAALAAFGLLVAAAVIAALGNSSSRLPDPVAVATPGFIILVLVEMIAVKAGARGRYDWRDSFASLTLGFGSTMAAVLVGGAVVAAYGWIYRFRLFDVPIAWWSAALCLVLDDLAYYAFHRSAHRVRWFWASHVVHHSSEHYNLTTALRQPWTSAISLSFAFRLPLFLIGFDPRLVLSVAGVNLVYQFWVHTEAVGRLPGWFERLFNTPSHHRVHHGVNARYLDRNYGGVFIVWDRLFGTFAGETEPVRYGLVTNLGSFNPLRAAFGEWAAIARDVAAAPDWRARLMHLAGPPGWRSDGTGDTADAIRARWQATALPADKKDFGGVAVEPHAGAAYFARAGGD